MKYSQWMGIVAGMILIAACFMPWTWYPDIRKSFTGFYTENNIYGRPGRTFIVLVVFACVFYIVPRVWAKRWNLLVCAISLAYAIKCFILFSGCYRGICPQKQTGIWVMLISSSLMMLAALLPDTSLKNKSTPEPELPNPQDQQI